MSLYTYMKYILENIDNETEAANTNTPVEKLQYHFKNNPETHLALAGNPITPPHILKKLSDHDDLEVQKSVASNPNTDQGTLVRLAMNGHVNSVKNNPVLPMFSLENPDTTNTTDTNKKDSDAIFAQILHHMMLTQPGNSLEQNKWNFKNELSSATDPEILNLFSKHTDPEIRGSVAGNVDTHRNTLEQLSKDPEWNVQYNLAGNSKLPNHLMELLSKHPDHEVRYALASNRKVDSKILHSMKNDPNPYVREKIADHSHVDPATLHALKNDKEEKVRSNIAYSYSAHPDTLHALRNDPSTTVKKGVARNDNTNVKTLYHLVQDEDPSVRLSLIKNKNTPSELLHKVLRDTENGDEDRYYLAKHENTGPETLDILSKDSSPETRESVINNKNVSKQTLQNMIDDPEPNIAAYAQDAFDNYDWERGN